jgi:hypothetical protein
MPNSSMNLLFILYLMIYSMMPYDTPGVIRVPRQQFRLRIISTSRSLESVLQDLRSLNLMLFSWIDAICINQTAVSERYHQVLPVREIYRKGSTVRIWLDHDSFSL